MVRLGMFCLSDFDLMESPNKNLLEIIDRTIISVVSICVWLLCDRKLLYQLIIISEIANIYLLQNLRGINEENFPKKPR